MVGAAGLPHQVQVPRDLPPLAFRADAPVPVGPGIVPVVDIAAAEESVVLAVGGDDLAQAFGFLHGGAHDIIPLDAAAVVGKSRHQGGQRRKIGQLLPFSPPGDGPIGHHPHPGTLPDPPELGLQMRRAVGGRVHVGHGADQAVAPPGRRPGARFDGLFIRKTRLSKMDMNINEAGKNETMIPMDGNAGDGVREILLLQKMTVFVHLSIFHNKRHGPPLLS